MALNSRFQTEAARWAALTARDPESNNKFVYCVKTTKIYCRPICKARLARRANVEFRNTPAEAEAAGYRPCKRCKPELMEGEDIEELEVRARIERARQRVLSGEDVVLEDLAKEAGWSKWHFTRLFKKTVGLSPRELRDQLRAEGQSENQSGGAGTSNELNFAGSPNYDIDWPSLMEGVDMANEEGSLSALLPDIDTQYPGFDDEAFLQGVSPLNPILAEIFPDENLRLLPLDPNVLRGVSLANGKSMPAIVAPNAEMQFDYGHYDSSVPSLFDNSTDSASSAPFTSFSSPTNGFQTPFEPDSPIEALPVPFMIDLGLNS